jgi:hypothetical protein
MWNSNLGGGAVFSTIIEFLLSELPKLLAKFNFSPYLTIHTSTFHENQSFYYQKCSAVLNRFHCNLKCDSWLESNPRMEGRWHSN